MSLVKNTIEVEGLIQALQNVLEAKMEHDKARDAYEGYSWGYHGRRLVDAVENAADEFGKRLDALIEKKVDEALERERSNVEAEARR
mgnify:CR=1 FL=1